MDEEEELDYDEGPLFSGENSILGGRNTSLDGSPGETDNEQSPISSNDNGDIQDLSLPDAGDPASEKANFEGASSELSSRTDPAAISSPLFLKTKSVEKLELFNNRRIEEERLDRIEERFHSFSAASKPVAESSESSPQTVGIDLSSILALHDQLNSLGSAAKQKSTLFLDEDLNERHEPHLDPKLTSLGNKTNPRGILHVKEKILRCDPIVQGCMDVQCCTFSWKVLEGRAKIVFSQKCFDEFFMGGCEKTLCPEDHCNMPDLNKYKLDDVWFAFLYVIRKAKKPKIEILKMLFQRISRHSPTNALAVATCIPKVRQHEKLEFAQYLVDKLTLFFGRRIAVMSVLFMTYPVAESALFNILLESFKIFDNKASDYLDLLQFLNFRAHVLPYRFVQKLIEEVLSSEDNDLIGIVGAFLDRLPLTEQRKISITSLSRFMEKINKSCSHVIECGKPSISTTASFVSTIPSSTSPDLPRKKRVSFSEHTRIAQISNGDHSVILLDDVHPIKPSPDIEKADLPAEGGYEIKPCVVCDCDDNSNNYNSLIADLDLSDDDAESVVAVCDPSIDVADSVVSVFKNICSDWILNGNCRNHDVCCSTHFLDEDTLNSVPAEQLIVASEFLVDQSVSPSLQVLEVFLNVLCELGKPEKLLIFRKCAPKLTTADSSRLTILVLSLLSTFMGRWDAVEMVLTPNLLDLSNKKTERFLFDYKLLESVMAEAVINKSNILLSVFDEILRRYLSLSEKEKFEIEETCESFVWKFLARDVKSSILHTDLVPMDYVTIGNFSSQFKMELHNGAKNDYFVVCLMLKYAVEGSTTLQDEALVTLYPFLHLQFSRARILSDILKNSSCFTIATGRSIFNLLGNAALCTVLRLFEDGQIVEATEMFVVMCEFKFDFLALEHKYFEISDFKLALTFCHLFLESGEEPHILVELFLTECLPCIMDDINSSPLDQVDALIEKIFEKFICKLLWCESILLFVGIHTEQESLTYPLNILKFYESTLRLTFSSPWNRKAVVDGLKLFLLMLDCGVCVDLQTATYRSLFSNAVKETYLSKRELFTEDPNILCPLIEILLARCIEVGAYPQFESSQVLMFYSSMTEDELDVYLFWWIYHYIKGMKRANLDRFRAVKIEIVQNCLIQDDSSLPMYFTLEKVDLSVQECSERLSRVLKRRGICTVAPFMFKTLCRGSFELTRQCVKELCLIVHRLLHDRLTDDRAAQQCCILCI